MSGSTQDYDNFLLFLETCRDGEGGVKYEKALSGLATRNEKSLTVNWPDLFDIDEGLATKLLDNPNAVLKDLRSAANQKLMMRDADYLRSIEEVRVRIRNLPQEIPLREIRAECIGTLIMISGIITSANVPKPMIVKAAFTCLACGEMMLVNQPHQTLHSPEKCFGCQGKRRLILDPSQTEFTDVQWLTVQERTEQLPPGQLPHGLRIRVRDDIVGSVNPGDRVKIICTVEAFQRDKTSLTLDTFLDANHIETIGKDLEGLDITPEDEEQIRELSLDPSLSRRMIGSITPSIKGHDEEKEAILYLLFGGVAKERPDVRIRGDIHVLLIGDPGTGKSQMLLYTARVAPRGILTTGRGSTAAGLTAATVKEQGGGFTLEAGALVLADMGVCAIDEMEKMRDEDRGAIHPAMEQQIVSIAKGGIVAELNARAAILAAANPTLGRYNPYQTIAENINLPVTLLNRFDLIFVIRDIPEPDIDEKIGRHILRVHSDPHSASPPVDPVLLRKYISYAKRIEPRLTEEAQERILRFYLEMRKASREGGEAAAIMITARQIESLIRLTEARARLRLRDETTVEDAEAAIALMRRSLEQVGVDMETGKIDIDLLYSGKPRSLQVQLQVVLNVISEMSRGGAVRDEDLFEALSEKEISRSETVRLIGVLMRDGTIFSPTPDYYRRT